VGCFRHMAEIANWNRLSPRNKHIAVIRAQQRRAAKPYIQQPLDALQPITSTKFRQYKN